MKISDHVRGISNFTFYREGQLWYRTDSGLDFSIPIVDTDGATFSAREKSLFFMRWIRKRIEQQEFFEKYDRARDTI